MSNPFDFPSEDDTPRASCHRRDDSPPLSRAVYIVLAILLGWLGVHNFYAGLVGRGLLQLLCAVTPAIVSILLLTVFDDPQAGRERQFVLLMLIPVAGILLLVSIVRDVVATRKDGSGRWLA